MEYKVYRYSAKGLKNNPKTVEPDDRVILLGNGSAILYKHNAEIDFKAKGEKHFKLITVDLLLMPDLLYRQKDSHLAETNEPIPEVMYARGQELDHIMENKIKLPIKTFIRVDPV